ncbi:RagB/SusD family nutrient uptake outer membrane protein [Pedobacter glucosidilyticus]|uniref:RagB/SusD family nutrient uptake outer membrane protein n=1 Tax=Pedobacter glucosidilyticus TaxID=1122941 RepID=UPI00047CB54A|nr:RagB/SusD family nutrient uptake outer membrane protein [Pedobacter glucosidilyticus]
MKKIKQIILYYTIVISLLLSACGKELLEEKPFGIFDSATTIKTEGDALAALGSAYRNLGGRGGFLDFDGIVRLTSGMTHQTETGLGGSTSWRLSPSSADFQIPYQTLYRAINSANYIIEKADELSPSASITTYEAIDGKTYKLKDRIIAEAKFLRALCFFYAVNFWGDVPMPLKAFTALNQESNLPKTSKEIIYRDLIVKDLVECANILPKKSSYATIDKFRASAGAARALLSKVYLYLGDYHKNFPEVYAFGNATEYYNKSKHYAALVLKDNDYALFDDYAKNHSVAFEQGSETILSFPHDLNNGLFDQFMARTMDLSNPIALRNPSWMGSSSVLIETYRRLPFDYRKWRMYYYGTIRRAFYPTKFWDPGATNAGITGVDGTVLRLAEVMLIYAEAANEVNQGPTDSAAMYLSMVRKRGSTFFGTSTGLTTPTSTTHRPNYSKFETQFTPRGFIEFEETTDAISTSRQNIRINFATVDLTRGVPMPRITGALTSVRTRKPTDNTGLYLTSQTLLRQLNYTDFSNELWNEYDYELLWEGTRLFDLFRKRKLETLRTLTSKVQDGRPFNYNYLLPIPANELVVNKNLTQNPGY